LRRLAGERVRGRRRDQGLTPVAQLVDQHLPAFRVELGEDVVQEEKRWILTTLLEHGALGQEERQHRSALHPLRAERAQIAAVGRNLYVVKMCTKVICPELEVAYKVGFQHILCRRYFCLLESLT